MKKRTLLLLRISFLLIGIISAVIFIPWDIVRPLLTPLPDTVQEQVDRGVDQGLEGIIVYVDQQGKAPAFYAAGLGNRENKVPTDPKALFKIASISKLYIAVAAAKLVNDQQLSLDDTLADLLPKHDGRIQNADQITLRLLLQHRSGIPNFTDQPDFPWFDPLSKTSEGIALILDKPADFEPNSRYNYSNTNYVLIGDILDKTLGYSHMKYIKEAIVDSLGLTQTYGLLSDVNPEDVASGYFYGYDDDLKEDEYIFPGGSMIATAEDVGIFLRALNDGSLLTDEEQAIYSSVYEYGHTGLLPGYQSIARYHEDIDTVVIQFTNISGGNMWSISEIVYNRILKILRRQ